MTCMTSAYLFFLAVQCFCSGAFPFGVALSKRSADRKAKQAWRVMYIYKRALFLAWRSSLPCLSITYTGQSHHHWTQKGLSVCSRWTRGRGSPSAGQHQPLNSDAGWSPLLWTTCVSRKSLSLLWLWRESDRERISFLFNSGQCDLKRHVHSAPLLVRSKDNNVWMDTWRDVKPTLEYRGLT